MSETQHKSVTREQWYQDMTSAINFLDDAMIGAIGLTDAQDAAIAAVEDARLVLARQEVDATERERVVRKAWHAVANLQLLVSLPPESMRISMASALVYNVWRAALNDEHRADEWPMHSGGYYEAYDTIASSEPAIRAAFVPGGGV